MKVYERLLKRIEKTIIEKKLIIQNDKVLVAFSGGGDSVFLLHMLNDIKDKYGFSLAAAHLNHSLREEADEEEFFSKNVAEELGIDFFCKKTDIFSVSQKSGESCETAGRRVRYDFFESLKLEHGFNRIATAHHRDDNAETILMHFLRGSGANGLKGIEYLRSDGIIRPMLDVSKEEILECCREKGWNYVTDKSNFETVYTRNRVRIELIPQILKYNPGFCRVVTQNAVNFAEDENFIKVYTDKIFMENFLDGGLLKKAVDCEMPAVQKRLLQNLYHKYIPQNLSVKYINAILSLKKTGQTINLPGGITAELSYGKYVLKKNQKNINEFEYDIIPGIPTYIQEYGKYLIVEETDKFGKNTFSASLPFKVRNRRNGDFFWPIGMDGRKKISDLFTDKKIPKSERNKIPILISGDEIINIGGIYRDKRFYKDGEKKYILKITDDVKNFEDKKE